VTSETPRGRENLGLTTRQRRRARALALQTLYEADVSGHAAAEVLQRLGADLRVDSNVAASAHELVGGVSRHRTDIDARITRFATVWPIGQMSAVDRNVLRLGIFEVVHNSTTIPTSVAINEAVELAKLYGSDNSARFVNGVLGRIASEVSRELLPVEPSVEDSSARAAPD
jgi:N utilization substance protein B